MGRIELPAHGLQGPAPSQSNGQLRQGVIGEGIVYYSLPQLNITKSIPNLEAIAVKVSKVGYSAISCLFQNGN